MHDSRLATITALLDDARCLIVDIVGSRPQGADLKDFNRLDAARQFVNSAIVFVKQTDSTHTPPDAA